MYLFVCVLNCLFMSLPDKEGWVVLEKPPAYEEVEDEDDHGIWSLFSMSMESEKFWVRFPKEPVYSYSEKGVSLKSVSDVGEFSMNVEKRGNLDLKTLYEERGKELPLLEEGILDQEAGKIHFSYAQDDKVVQEDHILSANQHYILQSVSSLKDHQVFVESLQTSQNQ